MKRPEALQYLRQFIPSFEREYADSDILGPMGWIAIDQNRIPDVIPADFLKGISVERNGRVFTVMTRDDFKRTFERTDLPAGRHCTIQYFNYCGNPHLYGTLRIAGFELVHVDKEEDRVLTLGSYGNEKEPELKGMDFIYKTEVGRILPREEVDARPGDWSGYDAGCRTSRFLDVKELLATAAYVALMRVEGPLFLTVGDSYYQEKDLLMRVSADDNVEFTGLFRKYLLQNE